MTFIFVQRLRNISVFKLFQKPMFVTLKNVQCETLHLALATAAFLEVREIETVPSLL